MISNRLMSSMDRLTQSLAMEDEAGVNQLITMQDDVVRQKVGEAFVTQMQHSTRVQGTFFPSAASLLAPIPSGTDDWVGQVASSLIALSLAQCTGHGFGGTVNAVGAKAFLDSNLTPTNPTFVALADQNYRTLFPSFCAVDGVPLSAFQTGLYGDPLHWGGLLADRLVSAPYMTQELAKLNPAVDPQGWYQVLYANLHKVRCLDSRQVQRVADAWAGQLGEKGGQPWHIPWTVYDHMLAATYGMGTFMADVQRAVNATSSETHNHFDPGTKDAWATTTTTYGKAANAWLAGCRGLGGFIVGPTSSNTEEHEGGGGGGCCFTAGTPILLDQGEYAPIERVASGTPVASRDGVVRPRSAQDVHWHAARGSVLYGFNDYPPFFTASHPFMTTTGWRAMSPKHARQLSRNLTIEQLQVGDILLQVDGHAPLHYREVPVERLTRRRVDRPEGEPIFSLHLDQPNPGYHAHGFLVAVNYPEIREDDFIGAFAGLSEGERAYLLEHFEAIAPFLRRGLGGYVGEVLRRALGPHGASR